jgi:hypothetical protein
MTNMCRRWSACFPCLCSFLAQLTREQMPFIEFNLWIYTQIWGGI